MFSIFRTRTYAGAFSALALALAGCSGRGASGPLPAAPAHLSASETVVAVPSATGAPVMSALSLKSAGTAAALNNGGPLLGADDFGGDPLGPPPGGWSLQSGSPSVCGGPASTHQLCLPQGNTNAIVTGSSGWSDYHIDTTVTMANATSGGVGLLGRVQSDGKMYELEIRPDVNGSGQLWWYIWNFDGQWRLIVGQPLAAPPPSTFALRFDLQGSQLSAYMGPSATSLAPLGGGTDSSYASGGVGVRNWGGTTVAFGTVSVTSDGGGTSGSGGGGTGTGGGSLPSEVPRSAGAFVASTGVNMHTGDFQSPYTTNVPLLESLTTNLGIKIIRDGMSPDQPTVCAENARFGAAGIKLNVVMDPASSVSDLMRWSQCVGSGVISSVEGWNEYDLFHPSSDGNWPGTLQNAQRSIYGGVKSQLGNVAVIAPALTSGTAASAVGNLASVSDLGNAHIYFNAWYPENGGYGSGGYGSIGYTLAFASSTVGSRPIAVTETGYGTGTGRGYVSEAVQAKYILRDLLALANAGVAKSMIFQMIDDGTPPFANNGLLHSDLSPKPAYNALKALLGTLADGSTNSPGTPLPYTFGGSTANLQHALFQKSDGSYALALWLGVPSSDPNTGADANVPAQQISITLGRNFTPTLASIDPNGNLNTQALPSGNSATISVTDQVQILTFK